MTRDKFPEIQFSTRVVDINSGQIAFGIVIQNNARGNFLALHARLLGKIDVKRIGLRKIIQFHGWKRRSKNALCIVTLSESVTTRKKRPCNLATAPQRITILLLEFDANG